MEIKDKPLFVAKPKTQRNSTKKMLSLKPPYQSRQNVFTLDKEVCLADSCHDKHPQPRRGHQDLFL